MLSALTSGLVIVIAALLWSARSRWRAGRRIAAGRRAALGVAGLPILFGSTLVVSNLYTYQALTRETPVAEIAFTRVADHRYMASLRTPDGRIRDYELRGDEWQLDARMIKWQGIGALLGLDPLYRLDRLGGRFSEIETARAAPPSLHDLSDEPGLDVWRLARDCPIGLIDAAYGSGVFLPMAHRFRYQVNMTASGLVARRLPPAT